MLSPDDSRPVVAVDWSAHRLHVTFDGTTVTQVPDLPALLKTLTVAHRIVVESTFESFDPAARTARVAAARAAGHEVYVYRPLHTARRREKLDWKKSDEVDARVIYNIATTGTLHLYPFVEADAEWAARRTELNHEYLLLRAAGAKPDLVAAAAAVLGPYRDLPEDWREALGNGRTYSESLMAATYFAATRTSTRAEFERLLGLHGSAYPSLLRSDVHHHAIRWSRKRGVTWQQVRPVLRQVRTRLVAAPAAQSHAVA